MLAAANLASTSAEAATGAEKAAFLADAKWGYETLSQDPKGGTYADQARTGLATLASASGDTAPSRRRTRSRWRIRPRTPFQQLLNSGVTAARAKQVNDATTLFEAAYKKNPYHRDVLYNLAIMYLNGDERTVRPCPCASARCSRPVEWRELPPLYDRLRERAEGLQREDQGVQRRWRRKPSCRSRSRRMRIRPASSSIQPKGRGLGAQVQQHRRRFPAEGHLHRVHDPGRQGHARRQREQQLGPDADVHVKVDFLDASGKTINTRRRPLVPSARDRADVSA